MMLGKRTRNPIRRTTSITEFTVDLSNVDVQSPFDPRNIIRDLHDNKPPSTTNSGLILPNGFDPRFLSTISPRNPRRNSADFSQRDDFLRVCGLCNRRLAPGRDLYMYRGDTAFCSLECRQQQMNQDEKKERCLITSKIDIPSTSTVGSDDSIKDESIVVT